MVDNKPQLALQPLLDGSHGSVGLRQVVAVHSVLWEFWEVVMGIALSRELNLHCLCENHHSSRSLWIPGTQPHPANSCIPRDTLNNGSTSLTCALEEVLSTAVSYGKPASGNKPRSVLGLLLSCTRPTTGGSQPWFIVRPPSHAPRSSISSNQQQIALCLLPGSTRPVTGKDEIDLHGSPSQEKSETTHPVASFRPHQNYPVSPTSGTHRGRLNRHKGLL